MPLRHLAKLGMGGSHMAPNMLPLYTCHWYQITVPSATPLSAAMPAPTRAPTPPQELTINIHVSQI